MRSAQPRAARVTATRIATFSLGERMPVRLLTLAVIGRLSRGDGSSVVGLEDRFDLAAEQRRQPERERKARVVFLGFDRVDSLAADAEPLSEVGLGPLSLGAQFDDAILQGI